MTIDNTLAAKRPSTSIIIRNGASLHGLRLVTDDAAALGVFAFAFAEIANVVAGGGFAMPAAYLLVHPGEAAYVGESGNVGRRLQEYALDPSKAFATEVFVLTGFERWLDKEAVKHFQRRLSTCIESAGVVRLIKDTGPRAADLPEWRIATLDLMSGDALPLLFDAGCHCLWPAPARPAQAEAPAEQPPAPSPVEEIDDGLEANETDDDGLMEIGVSTVPLGVEEQELAYGNFWTRGHTHEGGFVVAAGSEMRKDANPSANGLTLEGRRLLVTKGAVEIASSDRYRLKQAVKFPTLGIAGNILTGAHGGLDKLRPLPPARPFVIAL